MTTVEALPGAPLAPRALLLGVVGVVLALGLVLGAGGGIADSATDSLQSLEPRRVVDTRSAPDGVTVDGQFVGEGRIGAGEIYAFVIVGRGGVATDADAVMLNVTAVGPSDFGFLTVFPCGADRPNASNVNYGPGDVAPNAVLSKVGGGGAICVFSLAETHLVVDVNGYVPSGGTPTPLEPRRIVETRSGSGFDTVDGEFLGEGPIPAGETYEFDVVGRGGVIDGASAVMLNVTAVAPSGFGFLTVFPCGTARPNASNVNYGPGDVAPNAVLAKIGDDGRVCIFTLAQTDLIVDVNGYVPTGGSPTPLEPRRLAETRPGESTVDGLEETGERLPAGFFFPITVLGRGGVDPQADAVMLNVTAVNPSDFGFLTVYPCGTPLPNASNVNYGPGDVAPNAVLVKVGSNGQICVFSLAETDVIVDVNGYVAGTDDPPTTTVDPVDDTVDPPSTTEPPSSPPEPGGEFRQLTTNQGKFARWDPCSTVTFAVDPARTTPELLEQFYAALAEVESGTGLDFVNVGGYTATYENGLPSLPPNAEVGVTFADEDVSPQLGGPTIAFALTGPIPSTGEIILGTVTVDVTPGAGVDLRLVWMHEMGHLVGLDHVDDPTPGELMQPFYDDTLTGFGPGDLEGLWNVGAAQPCFAKPFSVRSEPELIYHDFDVAP